MPPHCHIPRLRSERRSPLVQRRRQLGLLLLVAWIAACSFDADKLRRPARDAATSTPALADANIDDTRAAGDLASRSDVRVLPDLADSVDLPNDDAAGGVSGTGGGPGGGTGGAFGGSGGDFGETGGVPSDLDSGPGELDTQAAGVDADDDAAAAGADVPDDVPIATNDHDSAVDVEDDLAAFDGAVATEAGTACPSHVAPIAYYPFDPETGSTLADLSGNGNDATLLASSLSVSGHSFVAGKVGSALELSAARSGYVLLPARLLGNACAATIALWLYINSNSPWQRVFDFGVDQKAYMFLTTSFSSANRMRFAITVSGYQKEQTVDIPTAFPTRVWRHVAVVLGASGGRIYLDGVEVAANPAITLRPSDVGGGSNYYLGRSQFSADAYLDGRLDELRIYDRELSAAEIEALMTAP